MLTGTLAIFAMTTGLGFVPLLSQAADPQGTSENAHAFRWIHPGTDPQLWHEIELAFSDELTPDAEKHGEPVYRYKYLQKAGVLVIERFRVA